MRNKLMAAIAAVALTFGAGSGIAGAHVTANPGEAAPGDFTKITFRVPNELPDSATVQLELKMPEDHPIASVSVKPLPGWEAEVADRTLEEPMDFFGEEVTEVVDTITWSGGTIEPGQFQEFEVSMGPLPEDAELLAFPAIQTYDNGEEVAWIEETVEGQEEPEHPAPVVMLTGEAVDDHGAEEDTETTDTTVAGDEHAEEDEPAGDTSGGELASSLNDLQSDVDDTKVLAQIGIALGAIALIIAIGGLVAARKSDDPEA